MADDKKALYRLLDANLNRAREGIRVVEDAARFLWNNTVLYKQLRLLRHQLHQISAKRFYDLLSARDVDGDSGRVLKEGGRSELKDVLNANMHRAQEALRVLEEYGKLFSAEAGGEFKRIRYRLYALEKKLWKRG